MPSTSWATRSAAGSWRWLSRFRRFWKPHLDALATEVARGKRQRRLAARDDDRSDG